MMADLRQVVSQSASLLSQRTMTLTEISERIESQTTIVLLTTEKPTNCIKPFNLLEQLLTLDN